MEKKVNFGNCINLGDGNIVCKMSDDSNTEPAKQVPKSTLTDEIVKAITIALSPQMTKKEASWIESTFVAILIGTILSGLGVALGFYIFELIALTSIPLFDNPMLSAIVIISILVVLMMLISFIQYRVTKSLEKTEILERFSMDGKLPAF